MTRSHFYIYFAQTIKLIQFYLVCALLFSLFRFSLLLRFGELSLFQHHPADMFQAFTTGFRFDTMVLCYGLIVPAALNLGLLLWDNTRFRKFINSFSVYYLLVFIGLATLILIIDQGYYTYFQSHINILAFGLVEDDTAAVFTSVWTDHPVLLMLTAFLIILAVIYKIIRQIYTKELRVQFPGNILLQLGFVAAFVFCFILGIRGSVSTFPLQSDDITVSENEFINYLTPNGLFTLKEAIKEKSGLFTKQAPEKVLKQFEYAQVEDALADFYGKPSSSFSARDIELYLTQQTDTNAFLAENPPNVVFFLMESMSNYYLDLHSPQLNLLGALEKHVRQDYLFRNFLSDQNGTIPSLEALLIGTPYHPLAQSAYRFKSYNSSVAKPYKEAGYHTSFITGGKLGWRNLDSFVPNQYFDSVEGKETILARLNSAEEGEWGTYDEYLFQYVQNKIQQNKTGKPQFIFTLTTTNHTPFERPRHYKPYPLSIPDTIKSRLMASEEIAVKNFTNYQYASDCLGRFLDKLKASPAGRNTIVVATGDHNTFMLFQYKDDYLRQKYSVPLYIYIPETYKKGLKNLTYDPARFGSHKDIFPTVFHASLSNKKYVSLGNNLFAPPSPKISYFAVNEDRRILSSQGAVLDYHTENPIFWQWPGRGFNKLIPTKKASPEQERLLKKGSAYSAISYYYFNNLL